MISSTSKKDKNRLNMLKNGMGCFFANISLRTKTYSIDNFFGIFASNGIDLIMNIAIRDNGDYSAEVKMDRGENTELKYYNSVVDKFLIELDQMYMICRWRFAAICKTIKIIKVFFHSSTRRVPRYWLKQLDIPHGNINLANRERKLAKTTIEVDMTTLDALTDILFAIIFKLGLVVGRVNRNEITFSCLNMWGNIYIYKLLKKNTWGVHILTNGDSTCDIEYAEKSFARLLSSNAMLLE